MDNSSDYMTQAKLLAVIVLVLDGLYLIVVLSVCFKKDCKFDTSEVEETNDNIQKLIND